jgi:hypothetical protein
VLAFLLLATLALQSMRPGALRHDSCPQRPCADPSGFEIRVGPVTSTEGLLKLGVTFTNHHVKDPLDVVSYVHTSPADFRLETPAGDALRPSFSGDCVDWAEVHVERGASSALLPLCFRVAAMSAGAGTRGYSLLWDPDLGLLARGVRIPLDGGPATTS